MDSNRTEASFVRLFFLSHRLLKSMKRTIQTVGIAAILASGLLGLSGTANANMDPDRGDGFDSNRAGSGYGGFYNESQRNGGGDRGSSGLSDAQRRMNRTTDQRATAAARYADLKEKLGAGHPDLQRAGTLMIQGERVRQEAREARRVSENDKADSLESRARGYFSSANRILEGLY